MRRLSLGWVVGRFGGVWMGASTCLLVCGGTVLASNAARSCASSWLSAANSCWCDLERSEVLLVPQIASIRGGTVWSWIACLCWSIDACSAALWASTCAIWLSLDAIVDSSSEMAELAMPASWRVACSSMCSLQHSLKWRLQSLHVGSVPLGWAFTHSLCALLRNGTRWKCARAVQMRVDSVMGTSVDSS